MRQLKIAQSITNRSEDSVSRYLMDIAQIDLLEHDEETNLAIQIRDGDPAAIEKLIKTNLRFVVSVAKQYQNKGMALSDLISEGNLGLIKAAQRFDYTKGFKFISFAVYWIRQSIIQSISDHKRVIRLPGNQISDMRKVVKATVKLEQDLERIPTIIELAEMLEMSEEKVADILYNGCISQSVDELSGVNTEMTLLDVLINENALSPVNHLFKDSLSTDMTRVLDRLPNREQVIIKYYFGVNDHPQLSYEDIGYKLGLTPERVRQLKIKAVDTLKSLCKTNRMGDYFNYN